MSSPTSPKIIKQVKREITKEDKDEEARLQEAIKDISLTTKEQQKAHKAALKADSNVSKLGKRESVATAAVQKATHKHDIATTHLHTAQRDADLKRQEDIRLQQELDAKKARLDAAMEDQKHHKRGRESRLMDLNNDGNNRAAETAGVGVAGMPGHHGTGAEGVGPGMNAGPNSGIAGNRPNEYGSGMTGNAPGQNGTGVQGPGTGVGNGPGTGPSYTSHHNTGAVAAGAGLAGGAGLAAHAAHHRDSSGIPPSAGQGYNNERIRDGDGLGPGQRQSGGIPGEDSYGRSGPDVGHHTDAGVGGFGPNPSMGDNNYPSGGRMGVIGAGSAAGANSRDRAIGSDNGPGGQPISSSAQPGGTRQGAIYGDDGRMGTGDTYGRTGNQGATGIDNTVRGADTGYSREGPAGYGRTGPGADTFSNDNAVRGADTGYPREGPDYGRTSGMGAQGTAQGALGDSGIRGEGSRLGSGDGYHGGRMSGTGTGNLGGSGSGYGTERAPIGQGSNIGDTSGYPSATGSGYDSSYGGGGGDNTGFRGDRMVGGSGTGADPGIRSGSRDLGGRSGGPELIGDRNIGMGGAGQPGYGADQIGQQNIHRGTGIGGRQGLGEDPNFGRDRDMMGGPGMGQIGDAGGVRGPLSGSQGFGEDNMPGGFVPGMGGTSGLNHSKGFSS